MARTDQGYEVVEETKEILSKARSEDELRQALTVGKESYYSIVIDGEVSA